MSFIHKGKQISMAVKNVGRLQQIIKVFSKHGFADFFQKMGLAKYLPSKTSIGVEAKTEKSVSERLRQSFEELGPTFVKLGQVLSTRPDVIPESIIEELTKLQDGAQKLSFDVIRNQVEKSLGAPIEDLFLSFNEKPLAAASIAQVHEAELKDGTPVVVKVQRPEIDKVIHQDIGLLNFLAQLLEKSVPEARILNPKILVEEFFNTLLQELDFRIEMNNMMRMAKNASDFPDIVIPKVYESLSSKKVLVQEKLVGIRIYDQKELERQKINRKAIVQVGAKAFFHSIMIHGHFHGDLHAGNLFILPNNKLGIIDFGIVGRLSSRSRAQFAGMLFSLIEEDYETLCSQYADLGTSEGPIDFDAFHREVRNTLAPHMGLSLSKLDIGRILIDATRIATKYQIRVPGDWMIVFKAILTVESMGRTLDPDFDLLTLGKELGRDLLKDQYSPEKLTKDWINLGREFVGVAQILPRHLKWFLKKFASNQYAVEFKNPELEKILKLYLKSIKKIPFSLLSGALFLSAALLWNENSKNLIFGQPALGVFFLILAFFMFLKVLI